MTMSQKNKREREKRREEKEVNMMQKVRQARTIMRTTLTESPPEPEFLHTIFEENFDSCYDSSNEEQIEILSPGRQSTQTPHVLPEHPLRKYTSRRKRSSELKQSLFCKMMKRTVSTARPPIVTINWIKIRSTPHKITRSATSNSQ
jgi:hypothetical protein